MYTTVTTILSLNPNMPQTSTALGYTATVAVIGSVITKVDNLINSKLAGIYVIPLATSTTATPPMISSIAEDLVNFYSYRQLFAADNNNSNDATNSFAEKPGTLSPIALLDSIRAGKMELVNTAGSIIPRIDPNISGKNYAISSNQGYTPVFDLGDITDWQVDPYRVIAKF